MKLEDIASISGKGGLFRVLKPTRTGAILESLDDQKKRFVVGMNSKVSILSDISIFIVDGEGSVPLSEVLQKVHQEFEGDIGLDKSSNPDELKAFLKFILPSYDEDRVYVSDIKKLISWYDQLIKLDPKLLETEAEKKDSKNEKKGKTEKSGETVKKKDKKN